MDFVIDRGSLCLDLRESTLEQIESVIGVVIKACNQLENQGRIVTIRVSRTKEICTSSPPSPSKS